MKVVYNANDTNNYQINIAKDRYFTYDTLIKDVRSWKMNSNDCFYIYNDVRCFSLYEKNDDVATTTNGVEMSICGTYFVLFSHDCIVKEV